MDRFVTADTDIVIEAPPRMANTFIVQVFHEAQGEDTTVVADHLHLPVQLISGACRGLPCVTIIRAPEDCVISRAIYGYDGEHLGISLNEGLALYSDFYKALLKLIPEKILVTTFDEVIKSPEQIIHKINHLFGTDFHNFNPDNPFVEANVLKRVEAIYERMGDGEVNEYKVSRPSAKRKELKKELEVAIQKEPELARARAIYEQFQTIARQQHEKHYISTGNNILQND
jgi:hypothetical protein